MHNLLARLTRWVRFNLMYLGNPPWDTGISPPELVQFIQEHPPGRAIDIGCGTGTNLVALARAGWQVTGVDFAVSAVRAARHRLTHEGFRGNIRAGDATRLDIVQGIYDLVLDIGCYHGLTHDGRVEYRSNLTQVLAAGGFFVLYAHWAVEGQPDSVGFTQQDFTAFCALLELDDRQDSLDRRGRNASWMRFYKKG